MVSIKSFEDRDFDDVLAIYSATRPPGFAAPGKDLGGYIAVDGSHIVGFGYSDGGFFKVYVSPDRQRQGIGSLLWEKLEEELAAGGRREIESWIREENKVGLAWISKIGFEPTKLDGPVCLFPFEEDLSDFDSQRESQGIVFETLAHEVVANEDCLKKLFALSTIIKRDVPGHCQGQSWEDFLRERNSPDAMTDAYFIAKDGDRYVGLSHLEGREPGANLEERSIIQQCLTGVDPAYRRRGIALALKLRTIEYSKNNGYRRIFTNSDNPAMIALNAKLRFVSGPWMVFRKSLETVPEGDIEPDTT